MPEYGLTSWALELRPRAIEIHVLERAFRNMIVPIIGRIDNKCLLLDLRTVLDNEIIELSSSIVRFFGTEKELP